MLDEASSSTVTRVTSEDSISSRSRPAAPAMTTLPRSPDRTEEVWALMIPALAAPEKRLFSWDLLMAYLSCGQGNLSKIMGL